MSNTQQLQQLAIALISQAKIELSDEDFNKLDIPKLQRYVVLMDECLPREYLVDTTLMRHAIQALIKDDSPEEVIMLVFLLFIAHLSTTGSNHPLERGIIRQKILGILPKFEMAVNKGLIRTSYYDKNADALAHIADASTDVPEVLSALMQEYQRLETP